MRTSWLNLVLRFSNRIYAKKQGLLGQSGIKIVTDVISLFFWEIILALVSLPLYIGMRPTGVVAYFEEKGGYERVSSDYSLRRVLTLTGVAIILLIWLVKLSIILFTPKVYGPLQLYTVSAPVPADILATSLISTETKIETARVLKTLPVPQLKQGKKLAGGDYAFSGLGRPLSTIVLLLSGDQTAIYYGSADKDGRWQITHSQNTFKLKDGNHAIVVYGYDDKLGVRSEASPEQYFKVQTTWLDQLTKNVDALANWSIVVIILLGVFLTFLTL
jgi:hypothetical protein